MKDYKASGMGNEWFGWWDWYSRASGGSWYTTNRDHALALAMEKPRKTSEKHRTFLGKNVGYH